MGARRGGDDIDSDAKLKRINHDFVLACLLGALCQDVLRTGWLFDSTLGYPGEGPDPCFDLKVRTANTNTFGSFTSALQASAFDDTHVILLHMTDIMSSISCNPYL